MSNAAQFGGQWTQAVQQIVNDLQNLRLLKDRADADTSLFANYLSSPGARTDITTQDLTNSEAAVTQLLFTFDSGNPTQKSFLFKIL